MSLLPWWDDSYYDDPADLDYGAEPCPTGWATEALVVAAGIVSWGSAASLFDHDDE